MKNFLKRAARYFGYEIRSILPPPGHVMLDDKPDRDFERAKDFATSAAGFSVSPHDSQAIRNLYLTGILGEPHPEQTRVNIGGDRTTKIGIWRKESRAANAAFVRQTDLGEDSFSWAMEKRIESKRRRWRLVLLGESVARGFFYDPHFTPAAVLEKMLCSHLGTKKIDIIDLAKSNLGSDELKTMAGQCLALDPDVVVIFAGNNWRPHLSESDIPYVDSILRERGVPGMKAFQDEKIGEAVKRLSSQVNTLLQSRGVKVIWIVPEFNLEDWIDPAANAPHLAGSANKLWRDFDKQADSYFRAGDLAMAEKAATEMVFLDGGTSSIPLRILAECARSKGDMIETRRYLEMCRDAEGWDPSFSYSPRTSLVIQNALRKAAPGQASSVIDLPDIFGRHLNGKLPNRRMFLDYCHLTAEAINVAMAAVASEVLTHLTGQSIPAHSIQTKSHLPAPKIEGKASFLAAVHNAHFYQNPEVVGYWCARALQFWPECAEIMTRFVDRQTRRVPINACKSSIELFELDELGTLLYLSRGGKPRMDMVLAEAVATSLRAVGLDIGKDISDLRADEHSIRNRRIELTDFYYGSTIPCPSERAWTSGSLPTNRGSRSIYVSAFWRTSKFVFFADKGGPAGLKLDYRVPSLSTSDIFIKIVVNGVHLARAPAARTWQTLEVHIPGDHLVEGMNHIEIIWPDEEECDELELFRAAEAITARRLPYFYRVFGEIHSLQAFDPSKCPKNFVHAPA